MCKVTCQQCGHTFVIVGIVPKSHDCYCSVKCLRENLAERSDTAYRVELLTKQPALHETAFLDFPVTRRPVGILGH